MNCSVAHCDRKARARGLCNKHYLRWRNGGDIRTKSPREKTVSERFWEKVSFGGDTDCWEWQSTILDAGYGQFHINMERGQSHAHRVAYELAYGPFDWSLFVCHKCDNKRCVNPSHLFLGTATDNMQDMLRKGYRRTYSGEANPASKLVAEQVADIKALLALGELNAKEISECYGVKDECIRHIKIGRTWVDVQPSRYQS